MADNRRALAALGPVAAGGIAARRRVAALRVGPREHIVRSGVVAPARMVLGLPGEGGLLVDVVLLGGPVGHVLGDEHALGVMPRTLADAVAGVDAGLAARCRGAEISAPAGECGAGSLCQRPTMGV